MKFLTTITTLLLSAGCLFAQVSNVRMVQRTDGTLMVDIYYDFTNPNGYDTEIAVMASDDNGATWELACSSSNQTGDVGKDISAGTDKHIVWDFYADHPNISGSQFKVRILHFFFSNMIGNDGTVYKTVKIGDQWWMAENLKETQYRNGDEIPVITGLSNWAELETSARCAFGNVASNANTYGYLYNWYACKDSRYLAPPGWHVPSINEWTTLVDYLGGENVAGGKLKETGTTHWKSPNEGATNESLFTALPAGARNATGYFTDTYSQCFFQSSSSFSSSDSHFLIIYYNEVITVHRHNRKQSGYSVRLVKD